jgi:hypothetical protein
LHLGIFEQTAENDFFLNLGGIAVGEISNLNVSGRDLKRNFPTGVLAT